MTFKWRKWNRIIHRDFGYLFVAMTIIYAVSGIALNHMKEWNPSYIIENKHIIASLPNNPDEIDKEMVMELLSQVGEDENYKKFLFSGRK